MRRWPVSWPRGVTVSTLDSESSDRGSNPREAFLKLAVSSVRKNRKGAVELEWNLFCAHMCCCCCCCLSLQGQMDTLGFEPRAFRMRSGCDTTTPCAQCCKAYAALYPSILLMHSHAKACVTFFVISVNNCGNCISYMQGCRRKTPRPGIEPGSSA